LIAAQMSKAGAGSKMAVRHVVITQWHKHGKPTVSQAKMEEVLGSRDEDKAHKERVRTYALRRLALEQAVEDLTDKKPERPTYR
jgi:hypothetical protein